MSSEQVIVFGGDGLGRGDQRLGIALAGNFLRALAKREGDLPPAIVFLNAGVRLLIEGSAVLAPLQELEERGVAIIACRASAQHFGLDDKLEVGDSLAMPELVDRLLSGPVISL